LTTSWGFTNTESQISLNAYGGYCKGDATLNFGIYDNILSLSLMTTSSSQNVCEDQVAQQEEYLASTNVGIDMPELQLLPPATSKVLVAEPLLYSPVAGGTVQGVELPGGWGSRTTLSTTLTPARVLELYNAQMERAGWALGRSNADELHDWSEWTFTDEAGQDWLATITVTHHEAYPNLMMPILIVFEK
jgi:hypothetical protein